MSRVVNVRVVNKRGFEQMMKAFRRQCDERGILHECKKHEFYEKPSDARRKKRQQQERERKQMLSANAKRNN